MYISFEALGKLNFTLSNVNLFHRCPAYRSAPMKNRKHSGFIYILDGNCTLESGGGTLELSKGALIYLPAGSTHTLTITSEKLTFYRIDFTLTAEGDLVLFSDSPIKLADAVSGKILQIMEELKKECLGASSTVVKTEKMCALFAALFPTPLPARFGKLAPALHYLEEHFTEDVDCRELAALCFLSTAQFYNLFRAHVGTTPLGYRDRLLLQRAKSLLETPEITVTEIADTLGFSDVAYFSNFFKKHEGISPTAYAAQYKGL